MSKIAVFPGSFSPFTIGHQSIVNQATPLFDKIIIAIGINKLKKEYFTLEDRIKWINKVYQKNEKIKVNSYDGLTIDFCKLEKADYIIRGIRDSHDFKFEKKITHMNKELNSNIQTIFFITPQELSHISSTLIREIYNNGGQVNKFLPKEITL